MKTKQKNIKEEIRKFHSAQMKMPPIVPSYQPKESKKPAQIPFGGRATEKAVIDNTWVCPDDNMINDIGELCSACCRTASSLF